MNLRPSGLWCDLAYDAAGNLFWAYSEPGAIVVEKNFVATWQQPVPTDFLRFTRIGIDRDGAVYACGAGHDDHGWMASSAGVRDFGSAVGNNPVAFGTRDGDLCVWIVYAIPPGQPVRYRIVRVRDAKVLVDNQEGIKTSQGIRDITSSGAVVWGDPTYGPLTVDGHTFNQYQQTANYLVGQRRDPDGIGALVGKSYWTPLTTPDAILGVHGAWYNGTLAVCGYFQGAHAGTFTPPYPVDAAPSPMQPPPVVVPPPPPSQPPPPQEPPVSTPNHFDVVQAVAAEHPDLVRADTYEAAGQLTEFVAKRLKRLFPAERWGLLSKSPGENQYNGHAVDAIICGVTNQVIDLMSGGGDRSELAAIQNPTPEQIAMFDHDIRLHWNEVPKRDNNNWMDPGDEAGTTTPPVQPPPPQPPADPNDVALTARVGALEAALAHILASQEALEGRINALPSPTPLPDLSQFAKKGDKVTVSAKLPFFGATVAHGTIDT